MRRFDECIGVNYALGENMESFFPQKCELRDLHYWIAFELRATAVYGGLLFSKVGPMKTKHKVKTKPWKSKTKQRMVFRMIHRKGFPTTNGQSLVFGLPRQTQGLVFKCLHQKIATKVGTHFWLVMCHINSHATANSKWNELANTTHLKPCQCLKDGCNFGGCICFHRLYLSTKSDTCSYFP